MCFSRVYRKVEILGFRGRVLGIVRSGDWGFRASGAHIGARVVRLSGFGFGCDFLQA